MPPLRLVFRPVVKPAYTVQPGDCLDGIAARFGVAPLELVAESWVAGPGFRPITNRDKVGG